MELLIAGTVTKHDKEGSASGIRFIDPRALMRLVFLGDRNAGLGQGVVFGYFLAVGAEAGG